MESSLSRYTRQIIGELGRVLAEVSDEKADELTEMLLNAEQIFVAGAGRSGLAARAFAMRLMHLGLDSHVVGEATTPRITERDVLLIGSGSGATDCLVAMAGKARSAGARIALVTICEDSPIGRMADCVLAIPAPTPKIDGGTDFQSVQPMGSLFEQSLLLTLDGLVLKIMERTGQDSAAMFHRHANLE
jgi:6-phospho-3-hexuloisomerase